MGRTRVSRGLIGVLAITVVAGVYVLCHNPHNNNPQNGGTPPASTPTVASASAAQPRPAVAAPAVTHAPVSASALAIGGSDMMRSSTPIAGAPASPAPAPTPAPAPSPAEPSPAPATPAVQTPATPAPAPAPTPTPANRTPAPTAPPLLAASWPEAHAAAVPAAHAAPSGKGALIDGKALMDSGDLVEARRVLNDALLAGTLSAADTLAAKQLISTINQTVIFSARRFPNDPYAVMFTVPSGGVLAKIAFSHDTTSTLICRLNNISDPRRLRAGATIKIVQGPFHAVVSKKNFTMDLYLGSPGQKGSMFVMSYPVGLGKDDSTPLGTWMVEPQKKLKNPVYYSPRGEGKIEAGDPKNPLGGFWIGLVGTDGQALGAASYGIHGTIEPDSIGKQASMGCIRMRNEDVAIVFDLLIEGKSIIIVKE